MSSASRSQALGKRAPSAQTSCDERTGAAGRIRSPHSTLLAAISLVLVALFAYSDAYHAALYRRALARAIKIEALLDSYLERLGIDAENAEAIMRTRAKLENHDFGMQRNLRPLRVTDLFAARPKPIFLAVYPAIVLITAALIIKYSL